MSEIKNPLNTDLKEGLWVIEWDGSIQHYKHIAELFINQRGSKRLRTIIQQQGELSPDFCKDWRLTKSQNAVVTYIGPVKDHQEYFL